MNKDFIDASLDTAIEHSQEIKNKFQEQTVGYIMAGFGVIVGLAWNDAVKTLIEYLFPIGKDTITAKIFYAVFITLILVITTILLNRWFGKKAEKK